MWGDGGTSSFIKRVNSLKYMYTDDQIILYILNWHNVICQLHLNKADKNFNKNYNNITHQFTKVKTVPRIFFSEYSNKRNLLHTHNTGKMSFIYECLEVYTWKLPNKIKKYIKEYIPLSSGATQEFKDASLISWNY